MPSLTVLFILVILKEIFLNNGKVMHLTHDSGILFLGIYMLLKRCHRVI